MRWISSFMLEWCMHKWNVHVQCVHGDPKWKSFNQLWCVGIVLYGSACRLFSNPTNGSFGAQLFLTSTLLMLHENRTHVATLTYINQKLQSKHMRLTLAFTECQCGWIHCKLFFHCALLLLSLPPPPLLLPFWLLWVHDIAISLFLFGYASRCYCGCNLASHRSVACVPCGKLAHLTKQFSNLLNYSVCVCVCASVCMCRWMLCFGAHVARNKVYPLKMPINKFNLVFALTFFDWDVTV